MAPIATTITMTAHRRGVTPTVPIRTAIATRMVYFQLGIVTRGNDDDEHEEDKDQHQVQTQLALDRDLVGSASTIGASTTFALRGSFAVVEIFLHTLLANTCIARAVAE